MFNIIFGRSYIVCSHNPHTSDLSQIPPLMLNDAKTWNTTVDQFNLSTLDSDIIQYLSNSNQMEIFFRLSQKVSFWLKVCIILFDNGKKNNYMKVVTNKHNYKFCQSCGNFKLFPNMFIWLGEF